MKEELPAGLSERQIAELVEDDEVDAGELVGESARSAGLALGFEPVDEVDDVEETGLEALAETGPGDADRQVRFAGARAPMSRILPNRVVVPFALEVTLPDEAEIIR